MPGGQASHKGSANKPNVNAAGVVGEASDNSTNPEDLLPEVMTTNAAHRAEQTVDYPPALERPGDNQENPDQND
ncbi:MAG TPA: hypothetical protein V6D29_22425 [Leptolyngbyaceae cyanobacterium]